MYELDFVTDMVEEQLVKGNLRWLASFNEIRTNYSIGDVVFPIYASGGLQEKGFFLSRIFSAFVTPRYKVHFLLYTTSEVDPKLLRKMILSCKSKFGPDDWIFIGSVQSEPLAKSLKEAVESIADKNIGIAACSLASKETVSSSNVLGKGLTKQLKLTEAKFEAFDWPNYLKSFTIVFFLGTLLLVILSLSGLRTAIQLWTLLLTALFSLVVAHRVYKSRYHTTLKLSAKGFQFKEGHAVKEGKWSDYTDVTIFITPSHETCIRLHSRKETFDLPLSRTGISRKETYNAIIHLIRKS